MVGNLASYRRCVARTRAGWPGFLERRRERMAEQDRYGVAAERVTENILEHLFGNVLDSATPKGSIKNQANTAHVHAGARA